MRRTLAHAKAMLRGGGLLALNELTRKTVGATVTFGLLDGWWLYEDPQLRMPGSPLLAEESWTGLLWSEGFRQVGLRIGQGARSANRSSLPIATGSSCRISDSNRPPRRRASPTAAKS
ncbi:hypothetical protein ACFSUI_24305 [Ralstonia solanacearum]